MTENDPAAGAAQEATDLLGFSRDTQNERVPEVSLRNTENGLEAEIKANWDQVKQMIGKARQYDQIMTGFAAKRFQQAQAVQQNPWANIGATIAGSMAAGDKTLPGWVQGLGRANLELNPRPEKLIAQGAEFQEAGLHARQQALSLADRSLTHQQASEDRRLRIQETAGVAKANIRVRQAGLAEKAAEKGNVSPAFYEAMLKHSIDDPEELKQVVADFVAQGEAVNKLEKDKLEVKQEANNIKEQVAKDTKQYRQGRLEIESKYKKAMGDHASGKTMTEAERLRLRLNAETMRQKILDAKTTATQRWEATIASAQSRLASSGAPSKIRDAAIQAMNDALKSQPSVEAYGSDVYALTQIIDSLDRMSGTFTPPPVTKPGVRPAYLGPSHQTSPPKGGKVIKMD